MNKITAPSPIRSVDYEAIEDALLQSARGRWFLSEFAERNRTADTKMLLDAITKLEKTLTQPDKPAQSVHMRNDLLEMAEAISQTRSEIASMRTQDDKECQFTSATEELDAIVEATEKATSDILGAAEDIQELAWLMREKGSEERACDRLDARATDIYTACSFQDVTGQRTSKVVKVLRFLENRVLAMIEIWGLDDVDVRDNASDEARPDEPLLNGPARKGEEVNQDDIDQLINAEPETAPAIEEGLVQQDTSAETSTEAAAAEPPAPVVVSAPENGTSHSEELPGEVEVSDFSAPPALAIDELDETKTQVLFT